MAPTPPAESRKAAKDLACADCQRRKKRCDKLSPCSNCVKVSRSSASLAAPTAQLSNNFLQRICPLLARLLTLEANTKLQHNVPCVPSSPAPPRKRRQPMKELLERLAACEERLKNCNCHQGQSLSTSPHSDPHHFHHHQHPPHGAPPSPPASAASRDAAIANMLDHTDEEEEVKHNHDLSRYSEFAPYLNAAFTTTRNHVDTGNLRAEAS